MVSLFQSRFKERFKDNLILNPNNDSFSISEDALPSDIDIEEIIKEQETNRGENLRLKS